MTLFIDAIGWVGVISYVVAYYQVSSGQVSGRSARYQWMNLLGAVGVCANAFFYGALPSAIVNLIWFGIAVLTLRRALRWRAAADPARPVSPESSPVHRFSLFMASLGIVVLATVGFLWFGKSTNQPRQPVLVYVNDWSPFVDTRDEAFGPVARTMGDVLRRADLRPEVRILTWTQALDDLQREAPFAVSGPFVDDGCRDVEARQAKAANGRAGDCTDPRVFHVSDPFLTFEYALFFSKAGPLPEEAVAQWASKAPGPEPWTVRDDGPPRRAKLGRIQGYRFWETLENASCAVPSAPRDGCFTERAYPTLRTALDALHAGDVDMV
ncbi:MAG: hypothetical protein AAF211_32110, partial [Myxococcota bacterium]